MKRRSSCNGSRKGFTKRRSENLGFDEFGFALSKKKEQKLQHRCHVYSYPTLNATRVKELCELLSYWNGSSFICRSQMERSIRMGIPPALRGRVWKILLNIDHLRDSNAFNYQRCLTEIRGPLVDLGVSEYGILSAIATLSDTENNLGTNQRPENYPLDSALSSADVTVLRQIALDLQRSFPTHRSLMGESPEAIEGQAKLFRVLIAYAKYNPKIGYSQGMSYIAAVLLMHLSEEEAFWALVVLLEKPTYLAQLFDLSLNKVQHQVKVFHQFLRHREPQLSQHIEDVGVSSVHFVMPWFLTLFTSLPCWDSVLAVWDLFMLHGLPAVFRTGLTILHLLESRLLGLRDEGAVLPLLLRVPVEVSQYSVLVPALWSTEVQDWELKCMDSLVMEDTHHGKATDEPESPVEMVQQTGEEKENGPEEEEEEEEVEEKPLKKGEEMENGLAVPVEDVKKPLKKAESSMSGPKAVFSRVLRLAQRYVQEAARHARGESWPSLSQPGLSSPAAPGRRSKTWAASSLSQAQVRAKRQSQRALSQHVGGASITDPSPLVPTEEVKDDRPELTRRRTPTGPIGRLARRRSGNIQPIRVKSVRPPRAVQMPRTPPPPPTPLTSALSNPTQNRDQIQHPLTLYTASELSTRCRGLNKNYNPHKTTRESQLI